MDTLTHAEQIDLALVKREAARSYVRKRHFLRLAVSLGILDKAAVRQARLEINNFATTWRAARQLLKGA